MPRKQLKTMAAEILVTEPLPIDDLEDATVEEYKKLDETCQKVLEKIKKRKQANTSAKP